MDDVEEIKKLKARYFRGLDSKDWDIYTDVFAEDVVVDLSKAGGEVYRGRDAFTAYARSLTIVQSVHHGHMPEITLTSDTTAAGVWAMEDFNIWEDGTQNHGYGHYLESYAKIDGQWRCTKMALAYLRVDTPETTPGQLNSAGNYDYLRGVRPAG